MSSGLHPVVRLSEPEAVVSTTTLRLVAVDGEPMPVGAVAGYFPDLPPIPAAPAYMAPEHGAPNPRGRPRLYLPESCPKRRLTHHDPSYCRLCAPHGS